MAHQPLAVGIVGCGNIAPIYARNAGRFRSYRVVACADVLPARAAALAAEHSLRALPTVDALLSDGEVEAVLNLTPPAAHAPLGLAALRAGKHLYTEKPLAIEREEAPTMLGLAEARRLRVGCAPDTFMGAGLRSCRRLVDEGRIGAPVAAAAFMVCRGPDTWHPDPEFFFQPGAGPLFDMGPYYLTALISLLGPVASVVAAARATFHTRTVGSGPRKGGAIAVNTPTHVAAHVVFRSGPIATLVTSFDVWSHSLPAIEVYGAEGTLSVPDPNTFDGPVRMRWREGEWEDVGVPRLYADNSRGLGLCDMARAVRTGGVHRASGELAFHVLDVMHAILESAREARAVSVSSSCERPSPLPEGWDEGSWMG